MVQDIETHGKLQSLKMFDESIQKRTLFAAVSAGTRWNGGNVQMQFSNYTC